MRFVAEAIDEQSEEAAILNIDQLTDGIKTDGTKVDFTYKESTIKRKSNRVGIAGITSHLTNFDTGESYTNLFEKVSKNKVIFGTTSASDKPRDKEKYINERMDGKAFGLTPENKETFLKEFVSPLFIKKIKQKLKLL